MKKIILLLAVLALLSFHAAALTGRSARLSIAFSFGSSAADDGIVSQGNYISAEENNTVLAIVSSGKTPETANESYSSSAYLLYMNQSLEGNRFLIAFTNGTNTTISSKLAALGNRRIPGRTFTAALPPPSPSSFPTFAKLVYEDVDITTRTRWAAGAREIVIENEGKNAQGMPKISIKVIK